MCAALGSRDRVNLVDDHGIDVAQGFPRCRGEHQEQRLGGGDQQIRRVPNELAALVGRGIARTHADGRNMQLIPEPFGSEGDSTKWRAKVLLDIHRERPQWRKVEQPGASLPLGNRLNHQSVEPPQKGRQGLS